MTKKRVLVVDGEARKTLSVVRSLGEVHKVFVLSKYSFSISAASRYCAKAFTRNKQTIVDQVVDICKRHDVDFLVATQEDTLIRLAIEYGRVKNIVTPTFPDFSVLDLALDKSQTLRIAQECSIRIPKTAFPTSRDEIHGFGMQMGFPLVVKPVRSISICGANIYKNRGPSYAKNERELKQIVSEFPEHAEPPILQEYIHGTGVGGFFLVNKRGDVVNCFAHQRIRDVNPLGSGSCFRKSIAIDAEVREASVKLLKAMNWEGVAMVEFRKDENGKYFLMEVNGRFWGSLDLARQSGLNFPLNLVRVYNHEEVPVNEYKEDVHVRWLLGEVLRTLRIMKGKPTGYPGYYPSRMEGLMEWFDPRNFKSNLEVLKLYDPLPFVAELLSPWRS